MGGLVYSSSSSSPFGAPLVSSANVASSPSCSASSSVSMSNEASTNWVPSSPVSRINASSFSTNTFFVSLVKVSKPSFWAAAYNSAFLNFEISTIGAVVRVSEPINIDSFPDLVGKKSLDEHFYRIGTDASEPYLSMAQAFLAESTRLPPKPSKWVFRPGWYRYELDKEPEPVPYPLENELVFDVEVMYKRSKYPMLCTAVSPAAWYGWTSPYLTNYANDRTFADFEFLIPFNTQKDKKLMIGYNVSYDRARVLEEYSIKQSQAFFLDGMALHVAISGICSQQRPTWQKHRKNTTLSNQAAVEEDSDADVFDNHDETRISQADVAQQLLDDPWLNKGAPNSLANVAEFHCGIKMDKTARDVFSTLDPMDIISQFNHLMDYCADDVIATYEVTRKLLPQFRQKISHPVSFASLRHIGSLILPTTKKWESYIQTAEEVYQENRDQVTTILKERVNELIKYIEQKDDSLLPDHESDPWLSQLNWNIKQPRLRKNGEPAAKQAYLTGYPEWYRELFKTTTVDEDGSKSRDLNITVRTRITPILLRLKWEGYPLYWTESNGWCFKTPNDEKIIEDLEAKNYARAKLDEKDIDLHYPILRDEGTQYELFKVPHPEGPSRRCTLIMSKSYSKYFESQVLTSEYSYVQEILDLNSTASYWMGNRARIMDQFVVYSDAKKNSFFPTKKESKEHPEMGLIIPKLVSMGTITRRSTENTWLTASNAKKTRIGSELKALVEAPKGYCFVGADVDSEELWIAALIGDSVFKVHGSTALAWMTLEGDKAEKTDLHSKTAEILGIARADAKVFNYGRIYGAGVKFATRLLKQCNATLSDSEAEKMAVRLYAETKGEVASSKLFSRRLYHGGTESIMFNALESIAHQDDPKTPVLRASITDALTARYLNKNNYLTSRTNWAIQSSGVDYLHLLIISMDYLIRKYKIDARLAITVHDELRYLAKDEDKYKVALLLQISNLWTRAMFCEQLGIKELPQSCAFFSEVDIDHVLRKDVTLDCITPSQKTPIPPGESLDIRRLLEITNNGEILRRPNGSENSNPRSYSKINFAERPPVINNLTKGMSDEMKTTRAKLENSVGKDEWRRNIVLYGKAKRAHEFDIAEQNCQMGIPVKNNLKLYSKATKPNNSKRAEAPKDSFKKRSSSTAILRQATSEEYDLMSEGDELLARELNYFKSGTAKKGAGKISIAVGKAERELGLKFDTAQDSPKKLAVKVPRPENASHRITSLAGNGKSAKRLAPIFKIATGWQRRPAQPVRQIVKGQE